jgi:ATP phosphoribosyltransferase
MQLRDGERNHERYTDSPQSLEGRLLFAVPKSELPGRLQHSQRRANLSITEGRLLQSALNLLEGADIQFRRESRLDIALVKNFPIALVFLPAADIPTFVGEGRVSLGITGRDTVAEHASAVQAQRRERAQSGTSTPIEDLDNIGCEEIMDLSFGGCKLQVQVPERGKYVEPKDLIGKNIGTSFVHLAEDYFAALEAAQEGSNVEHDVRRKLRTKIIELSGSVEAACALGVADGIVDLVGACAPSWKELLLLTSSRIRRDYEGCGPEGN